MESPMTMNVSSCKPGSTNKRAAIIILILSRRGIKGGGKVENVEKYLKGQKRSRGGGLGKCLPLDLGGGAGLLGENPG